MAPPAGESRKYTIVVDYTLPPAGYLREIHLDRYLVFYCPMDLVYSCATLLPLRLMLSGMKEVTRTWKVLSGVTQAHSKYKDSLLVMIAIGWARGQNVLVHI